MNILGVFIVTLSWGFIRATTYSEGWTDQQYHQLPGVPDRPLAYQHLPSRVLAKLPDEQRIYHNSIENNRAPQIADPSPIQQSSYVNSLPLQPQLNKESHVLNYINEPYNLPHQNQVKEFSISGTRNIQNNPVLQEPYRQNVELREMVAPNAKYIQQAPESVTYLKRNQEVSNTPLRQKLGVQHIFSNPKIREVLNKTKQTKRYMVIYPDGRVSHVDNVDAVLESNPQHILISAKELPQNRFDANFLQQTENTIEQNKKVNDVHIIKKIATEPKVEQNPIDLILNETIPTSQSKSAEKLESKPIIVVQSFIQPNNQTQLVDSPPGTNKVKKINSENTKVTSNEISQGTNLSQSGNYNSSNETFITLNTSNMQPYTNSMIREEKNNGLNKTDADLSSTLNTQNLQPYIHQTNRVADEQGNFTNTSNQDSSNETYTTFNSSNKHPYTDAMIMEDKNNGLNKTDDGQNSTLNTSNTRQYINQSNVVEVEQGNLTNTSNQDVSNETYTTFDSPNLHPYTDAAIREEKNKGLNENSGGQNSTSVILDIANIQPHRESDQGNFTKTSTLVNKTSEYKNQANKSDIDPANSNEHISPVLNNTEQNGNSQASNETVIEPQPKQSQIVEQTALQKKTNSSFNKINKEDNNLTSDILEQKTDKLSENKSSVTSSSVVQETSKPKSEEQDFNSKTLDSETNPNDSSSDPIQPSDKQENTEKHNKEQSSSENQTEVNNSTGDSDEATGKTHEETGLHNNSSTQNETHYSDFVLSLEETDSGDNFDFWESSTSWEVDPEGEVTSEEGDAWKKLTIKKDDFDVVLKLELPLQPITVVDTNGEEHACVLLLDPTASLSYIICK